jgi:cytochrome c peroxidase
MWDGGVNNVENQPINPIQNPVEMGEALPHVLSKLSSDATYRAMFKDAFGDETINSQRLFKALAQFMIAMVSYNSRYDKYIRGEAGGTLTGQELNGLSLFRSKCESCHKEPLFSDYSFHNNGLSPDPNLKDSGRMHITGNPADLYKFKVPSLRNVELSRPYMHDGRFNTLDAAVEHYRTDIYHSPTLDTLLTNGISMSDQDKQDIISFLLTLTDTTYVHDSRFSDPNNN